MDSVSKKVGFGFWLLWVVFAIIGWSARRLLLTFFPVADIGQFYLISFIANGMLIGLLQWVLVWPQLEKRDLSGLGSGVFWIVTSGLGWILAWGFNLLFPAALVLGFRYGYSLFSISLMAGGISALMMGIFQARILRRYTGSGWLWIPTIMASMVTAMVNYQTVPLMYPDAAALLGGLVYGVISGTGMLMILRNSRDEIGLPEIHEAQTKYGTPDFR